MPNISVNLVVLNGEKYIRHCLDSVLAQTYPHELIELNILDNGSNDETKTIIKECLSFDKTSTVSPVVNSGLNRSVESLRIPKFFLLESKKNLGMWPGQEELLKHTNGKYIVALCVDIMLDKDFVKNAVEALEKDDKIGALQPKIYKFDLRPTSDAPQTDLLRYLATTLHTKVIDTCGFQIFKSRRIVNIGHGETDTGQYDNLSEIFAVEGAAPVFCKSAFESCGIKILDSKFQIRNFEIVDHDYFWYGDDLDLAWRMRLFGWKQVFAPNVIAWHDRQTTKTLKKSWQDYLSRVSTRKQIPIKKRRLDWRNTRWTLVKNDYIINILKDLPRIVAREISVLGYAILFEPKVLKEIPTFFRYLPRIFHKRKEVMRRAVVGPEEIRRWFK